MKLPRETGRVNGNPRGRSDPAELPEQIRELSVEVRAARSSDNRLAQGLRRFGPLGIIAIVLILAGNSVFVPLSALLALVWASAVADALARDRFRAN
ncbi:MAG: hypothetical protein H0V63_14815 [Burkholderiaceae bacterium]|nr:hypothetical protein [Burkholderiaceae bacterium]